MLIEPPYSLSHLKNLSCEYRDWLGNPTNIRVENNAAVGYVGCSLIVLNPLISVHKLSPNKLVQKIGDPRFCTVSPGLHMRV